jgi:suppressor of fused-like protein
MSDDIYDRLKPGEELPAVRAINHALEKRYGEAAGQWGTAISWALGGPDPLDRVRAYRGKDHWHYVGYGMSDLDEKSFPESPLSGFGYELTFRLRDGSDEPPAWPVVLLQTLARYVWETKNQFAIGHYFPFNSSWQKQFHVPGIVFAEDAETPPITTDYGKVVFVLVAGVPKDVIDRIAQNPDCWDEEVAALRRKNPLLVTDVKSG